jgi:hypothetical protein
MGARFRPKAFHDFVLAQGLLPLRLLKKAVFEEFVGFDQPALRSGSNKALAPAIHLGAVH